MTSKKPTICLLYGFGEGPWHGRQIQPALESAGFTVTTDVRAANIILAHSAGCFDVPQDVSAARVILVGPPFWPGKSPAIGFVQKGLREAVTSPGRRRVGFLLRKTAWNLRYILGDIPYNVRTS